MTTSARNTRFRPSRAGIINLWDYRDQEFSFADGRLVLRGPNGSGKTKALEVLFPFVLDGRIEPRRLNPFAGEERTMKSNLLYRKQESAYSYVWMEFTRGSIDDPEAVTVGIGMRATRSNDKVTRWYFVADGRVGVDFSLLGADDRPLTRRQLADELGSDAIDDRPIDYRAAIDARMFGLGPQRYDQLINLILTLRRPQLAKNLDPKGLSQALTDGLRPLDEQMVLDAARSFSDMEEVGRALEGLVQADSAAKAFVGVYAKYLRVAAKTDVDKVAGRLASVEHATTALFAAKALRERRHSERSEAGVRLAAADRALDDAVADRETLQQSSAYEGKQQLDDLADAVRKLEVSTQAQVAKSAQAQSTLSQRTDDQERSRTVLNEAAATLARSERELTDAAEEAGIAWTPLPAHARADQLTVAIRGHAEERDASVRAVRAALAVSDRAAADRARADRAASRSHELHDTATAEVATAEAAVEAARSVYVAQLRTWWDTHRDLYGDSRSELFDSLLTAAAHVGDDSAPGLTEVLTETTAPQVDDLQHRRRQARSDADAAAAQLRELDNTRKQISDEKDDAPPPSALRRSAPQHAGAPLWRLVRFAESVGTNDAASIEAALQAADLLDGWVCADKVPDDAGHFLLALPSDKRPIGVTLADYLEVEDDTGVPGSVVADLLASIAVDDSEGLVRIGLDGRYSQGVQRGRHSKSDAEFIGATARARRRALRIAELDAAMDAARAQEAQARDLEAESAGLLTRISKAAKALPRAVAVVAALRTVSEAAGALRTRVDALAAAQRELDVAVAESSSADKKLRTIAAQHRVSRNSREIDALAAAVRHFENSGNALLRQRTEHLRESERFAEATDRLEEARGLAEEFAEDVALATQNVEQQKQKLDTLRDALGADAEQVDADLTRARERIEAAKAEQRTARKLDREAGEQIGQADGAHRTAIEGLRSSLTETLADVQALAPYAQRDVLALLGIAQESSWPTSDAAWSSVDQLLYRFETAETPDTDVTVLPKEVAALNRELLAATESVQVSDSLRKSTRSAVTSALQEFDARLAASGQDFRLHWDAADGLTVVRVEDEQGDSTIAEFADRIALARSEQELLLTDAERRILEDALLTGLAQQIHERTIDARDLIARMGSEMKQRRMSSGNTIGVHWVLADTLGDDARAVSKLLDRDASALGPDELARIRAHFASEIRTARAAHPERSYPEILATTLDYRRWRVFAFTLIGGDGSEDRLTVARHSALSGGEQSVSLHLPLFAAAHVMLSSADPHSPRLLALDEAFAGVDDNGRSELLGLSVQFDLDLFMTGYDLWITYADVPACAHYDLAHSTAENSVSATLLVWEDGELLAEHDGSDLAAALGSPLQRRVPATVEGGLEYA